MSPDQSAWQPMLAGRGERLVLPPRGLPQLRAIGAGLIGFGVLFCGVFLLTTAPLWWPGAERRRDRTPGCALPAPRPRRTLRQRRIRRAHGLRPWRGDRHRRRGDRPRSLWARANQTSSRDHGRRAPRGRGGRRKGQWTTSRFGPLERPRSPASRAAPGHGREPRRAARDRLPPRAARDARRRGARAPRARGRHRAALRRRPASSIG